MAHDTAPKIILVSLLPEPEIATRLYKYCKYKFQVAVVFVARMLNGQTDWSSLSDVR